MGLVGAVRPLRFTFETLFANGGNYFPEQVNKFKSEIGKSPIFYKLAPNCFAVFGSSVALLMDGF
jgi:hypothetical protein